MRLKSIVQILYDYQLHDDCVRIMVLGGIPVLKLSFRKISSMQIISFKETLAFDFKTFRCGNRMTNRVLEINKTTGLPRRTLITPHDPERYIEALLKFKSLNV